MGFPALAGGLSDAVVEVVGGAEEAEASEVSRRVSSKGIVGLQVMGAEVAVTQSGPVGQGEPEGRLSPRFRRRVSRMWAMEPAPRASRSRATAMAAASSCGP